MIEGHFLPVTHRFIIELNKMSPENEVYGRMLIMWAVSRGIHKICHFSFPQFLWVIAILVNKMPPGEKQTLTNTPAAHMSQPWAIVTISSCLSSSASELEIQSPTNRCWVVRSPDASLSPSNSQICISTLNRWKPICIGNLNPIWGTHF